MCIPKPLVLALAAVLVPVAHGAAQNCLGNNSFANGKMALGGQGNFYDGGKRFAAIGGYGMPKSWYVGATIGTTSADGGGDSAIDFGGQVGYQFAVSDNPLEICPYGLLTYSSVSSVHTTSYGFGGGIGWRNEASDNLAIVPAAGLEYISYSTSQSGYSGSYSSSQTFLWLNVGFVVNKQWTFVPGFSKSTKSGSSTDINISVIYSFGK